MVVDDNESTAIKNPAESMAISIAMAMAMQQYDLGHITQYPGLHSKPLDATICRVSALYHPGGRHGQRI